MLTSRTSAAFVLALALIQATPATASAQVRAGEPGPRPRIGLVLGGGGAKGGAHIGVLRVLEELKIPIDFIAGTSAGAVMGGLYASGMSIEDLEGAVRSTNWQDLLTDRPPRNRLSFLRKQDDRKSPTRLELGFNERRFQLPPGLITGQNVETTLRALALPAARVRSFQFLGIPFRAVATDIETGEMVVLDRGDLATAIRASMSLPGAFAPVEVDGRLLVDGAVVRNLPVDVVRAMGADVVIAVDLTSPLRTRDELSTAIGVSGQVGTIATRANTVPQREALVLGRDVLIIPPVEGVQVTEFRRLPETIELGAEGAREVLDELRRYSVDDQTYAGFQVRRESYPETRVVLTSIQVSGSGRLQEEVLRDRLNLRTGVPLSEAELTAALERVYGLGLFERVDYRLEPVPGQGLNLIVRPVEKAWGPGYTRIGVAFGNDLQRGTSSFTLLANHIQTLINPLGAELQAELRIGDAQAFEALFHQPVAATGAVFLQAGVYYREELLDVAVGGAGSASRGVDELGVSLAVGRYVQDWGELRVDLLRGAVDRKGNVLADVAPGAPELSTGGFRARFSWDVLDDRAFPDGGVWGYVDYYRGAESLGSEPAYDRLEASFLGVASRGNDALLFSARGGTAFDGVLPPQNDLALGGFGELSGLRARELTGNHLLFGRVAYRRQVAVLPSGLAGGNLSAGISLEAGNVWARRDDVDLGRLRASIGAFAGLQTILGPVYVSVAKADRDDYALFLSLGHAF